MARQKHAKAKKRSFFVLFLPKIRRIASKKIKGAKNEVEILPKNEEISSDSKTQEMHLMLVRSEPLFRKEYQEEDDRKSQNERNSCAYEINACVWPDKQLDCCNR